MKWFNILKRSEEERFNNIANNFTQSPSKGTMKSLFRITGETKIDAAMYNKIIESIDLLDNKFIKDNKHKNNSNMLRAKLRRSRKSMSNLDRTQQIYSDKFADSL